MSEDLNLVRSGYKAFAAGDIETVFSLLDPDITLREREPAPRNAVSPTTAAKASLTWVER